MRITLTEPQTALAGVILKISFVRLKVSMVTFSKERVLSRRFDWCDLGSMVETEGSWEKARRWTTDRRGPCQRRAAVFS